MKPWIASFVLLCLGVVGCRQQIFLCKEDVCGTQLVPTVVEKDKTFGEEPINGLIPAPPTVVQPERPPRHLTLQEAIAISLENGTTSGRGLPGQGAVDDTLASFQAGGGTIIPQSDSVRVLALAPAISQTSLESSLARFDAQWVSSMLWSNTDQFPQGLNSFQNGDRASFLTGIMKPLPTGGVIGTFFETDYQLLDRPPQGAFGVLNPSYTTRLRLSFEQPLLQNAGVNINQLLNRFPFITGQTFPGQAIGAFNQRNQVLQQGPGVTAAPSEGILVARLRFTASRAEFERQLNNMVLNVEVAYWNLYQAYGELYTFEEVLRIAHKSWMINAEKFKAGTIGPANFFPIRGQYEEFRGERVRALGKVLEAERNLRGLMGLPVEDGTRLVPITPPTLSPYRPDWNVCLLDALNLRPELVIARESLRATQYNLDIQKNFLKPDLRFAANYVPTGFGTRLDGRDNLLDGEGNTRPANALQSLRGTHFEDWSVGLSLNVPLGYRVEHASLRSARLALAQSFFALKDQEERAKRFLTQQYQKLSEFHARIEMAREERKAHAQSVEARFAEFAAGKTNISDFLLEAQRRLALAQQKEYQAIADYNNTLSRLEFARGSLLRYNNVVISEGGLPECAEIRAVENERQRSEAIILRDPADPAKHGLFAPGRLAGNTADLPTHLEVPTQAVEEAIPETGSVFGRRPAGGEVAPHEKAPLPFDRKPSGPGDEPALPGSDAPAVAPETKTTPAPKTAPPPLELEVPEVKVPEVKAPEVKAPEVKVPEDKMAEPASPALPTVAPLESPAPTPPGTEAPLVLPSPAPVSGLPGSAPPGLAPALPAPVPAPPMGEPGTIVLPTPPASMAPAAPSAETPAPPLPLPAPPVGTDSLPAPIVLPPLPPAR